MSIENRKIQFTSLALVIPALAAALISGRHSAKAGTAPQTAPANNGAQSQNPPAAPSGNSGANTGATTGGNAPSSSTNSKSATGMVGDSCVAGDANHICLAVHFVSYKDPTGKPVASTDQVKTIVQTMNKEWAQCDIGFQVEKYEAVDPTASKLDYGADSQNETDQIRKTYGTTTNQLLAVNTGPWGTAVNAWTNLPGDEPYGAILEASIVDYGGGIIYAHEFGHYLGLQHVADESDLMNPVIYTTSTKLDSTQCQQARDSAQQYWSAMIRKK